MTNSHFLCFEYFRLDLGNECLWRGAQAIPLTPTAFALLRYLAEHPGRLLTKDELLKAVWPEAIVSEGVLTTHISILRHALSDAAKAPQYIETVHRRGYRFIAPFTPTTAPVSRSKFHVPSSETQHSALSPQHSVFVGRKTELAQLHEWLEKARRGERQVVFVSGEAGIGKTTVVEAFLERLVSSP